MVTIKVRGVFRLLQRSVNEPEKCVKKGKLCLKTGVHGLSAGNWQNGFLRMAYTYHFSVLAKTVKHGWIT